MRTLRLERLCREKQYLNRTINEVESEMEKHAEAAADKARREVSL